MWYHDHSGKILLGVLPAVLFAGLFAVSPLARTRPAVEKQATYREQVHPDTFAARYGDRLMPMEHRVRTIVITRELPLPTPQPNSQAAADLPPAPSPAPAVRRIVRKVSLDICQRHKMRKVHYGRTWRCRR
jgi:hypothetical protein